jgi:hypothetical protein
MHVETSRSHQARKDGSVADYERHLLRRSYRQGGKVRKETLANLSHLPDEAISAVRKVLAGGTLIEADQAIEVQRSLPHGHLAAVAAMAGKLGLPGLLGPPCRARDLAYALILSRVVHPGSKLSTRAWWADTTLGADLDIAGAGTDEIYAAMDWLADRHDAIEKTLTARHLDNAETNPTRMALFDLSSSWVEGTHCQLADRGYSRDGKKGKDQIEYGLLTDPDGRPVAVRVFPGNTADPTAFTEIVTALRDSFGLDDLVLVGDRGMITKARIAAVEELNADSSTQDAFWWITALRAPAIGKLAADDGPLQMSLFDQHNLAEITHPDYPGERLIACRNPALAADRARKREALLAATEAALAPIAARVTAGRLAGAEKIGLAVGKVINKYKMEKHFHLAITEDSFTYIRNQESIATEAAQDGIYVIRTNVPENQLEAPGVVTAYKNLAHIERDWRIIKADDLALRPIHHHLSGRVKAHVLICMLACYLVWHLRRAWAELTFTDEDPPERVDPVAPAARSGQAAAKAAGKTTTDGSAARSFAGLLAHLGTLTRNSIRVTSGQVFDKLTTPTPEQRRAFDLIDAPVPLTLT